MRIFLTGVSCVGKTTIGEKSASLLGYAFFDLDEEIESYFGTPLERLQDKYLTMPSFRKEAAKALINLLTREDSHHAVIALPPSGLRDYYWRIVKNAQGRIIVLSDNAANILKRIVFYDKDSRRIERNLTDEERQYYLKDIKEDITYFRRTYKRADIILDIAGLDPNQAARKVKETVTVGGDVR